VTIVEKVDEFIRDPDCSALVCREIDFNEILEYIEWGDIGKRMYNQARDILFSK